MKIAVIYYSLEGNTKYVANQLVKRRGVDAFELIPITDYPVKAPGKFVMGGMHAMLHIKPKLNEIKFNPDQYDVVVIGTPEWASTVAPPIRTFLKKYDISNKKVVLFTCDGDNKTKKCMKRFKRILPKSCQVLKTFSFQSPKARKTGDTEKQVHIMCNYVEKLRGRE